MIDLRKSMNVNPKTEKREYRFNPIKWFKRNYKNILVIIIIFISLNIIFNPGGISSFLSNWIFEFESNWKIN